MAQQLTDGGLSAFQENITKRVQADIGSLLPEDALKRMIERAVEETFFKPRRVQQQYGNDIIQPGWFVEAVAKAAQPQIEKAVAAFVEEHQDVIAKAIGEFMTSERLTILTVGKLTATFEMMFREMIERMRR